MRWQMLFYLGLSALCLVQLVKLGMVVFAVPVPDPALIESLPSATFRHR